jgi:hypothetical protein
MMLAVLRDVLVRYLPGLLASREGWNSVHVLYHPPRVERLWIQHGNVRVFLHRIYPCDPGDSLFHPHPWPSAVRIMSGRYEHLIASVGNRAQPDHGPVLNRAILVAGAEYQMTHPDAWHSVRPLDGPSDSIMVTGPMYSPPTVMPSPPTEKQGPLTQERFEALLEMWRDRIDNPVGCGTCGWEGRHHELVRYEGESPHVRCPMCMDEDQVCSLGKKEA